MPHGLRAVRITAVHLASPLLWGLTMGHAAHPDAAAPIHRSESPRVTFDTVVVSTRLSTYLRSVQRAAFSKTVGPVFLYSPLAARDYVRCRGIDTFGGPTTRKA